MVVTLDELDLQAKYNNEAEVAVIGAILQGGKETIDALNDSGFDPSDFYVPRHETVYRKAMELSAAGEPVDVSSVCLSFGRDIAAIGGNGWILEAWDSRVRPASAVTYAKHVTEIAVLRRTIAAGMRAAQRAYMADPCDHQDVVNFAQGQMQAVADATHGHVDDDMGAAIDEALDALEVGGTPPVPTGIGDLDRLMYGGLRPGTLTTIAARPAVGKTVVGGQVAVNVAFGGGNVGYTTLEMARGDMLTRTISAVGMVDYGRLLKSPGEPLTEAEWRAVRAAAEKIRDSGLLISRRTSVDAAGVRSDIRAMIHRKGSCALWVVDYLGLVDPEDKKVIREQQVAGITRGLKKTALETGVPIVVLCQLNREGEKSGRPPVMTDLRESGSIEQDSDNVLLLHRDMKEQPTVMSLRLAKNRRGPMGEFEMTFEGSYQRLKDKDWTPYSAVEKANVRAIR